MVALVTLRQVNDALRLDLSQFGAPGAPDDERTPDVELKITQSQAAILDYLKVDDDKWDASNVPPMVTASIILGVRGLFDGEDSLLAGLSRNEWGNPIVGLLQRLRDPAIA